MKTGYLYISSNGTKEDNNAFLLTEIQQLFDLAYKAGITIRQVFIDFNESGSSTSKPQLTNLMEAMSVYKGRFVLVTNMRHISRNKELLRTFLACCMVTDTQIICLSDQGKKKGEK
jgi:DNA invertase Pin-like site-specific DNA recombinase